MKCVDVMRTLLFSISVIAMGCSSGGGGGGGGTTGEETGGGGVSECLTIHTCDKACDQTDDPCQDACVEGASDEALDLYGDLQLCMVGCLLDCMSALTEFTEGTIAGCESSCETDGCATEYMACATAIEPSEESGEATGGTEETGGTATGDDPEDAETGDDPQDAETGADGWDWDAGEPIVCTEDADCPVSGGFCEGPWLYPANPGQCSKETGTCFWNEAPPTIDCSVEEGMGCEDGECVPVEETGGATEGGGSADCEALCAYAAACGEELGGGAILDEFLGNCVTGCEDDAVSAGLIAECQDNTGGNCLDYFLCLEESHETGEETGVEPECVDDNDCSTDAYCDGNFAVPGISGDCNNGSCQPAPGLPAEDCEAAGKECVAGECVEVQVGCGDLTFEGCCASESVIQWCQDGQAQAADCANSADPTKTKCGWSSAAGVYDCTDTSAADPSGANPLSCGEAPPAGLDCNDIQACISDCDADAPEAVLDACLAGCEDSAKPSAFNAHTNLVQCIQTACQNVSPSSQPACIQAATTTGGACQPQALACFGPDGSDPPFTCGELVTCLNSCPDDPSQQVGCINSCQGAADEEGNQIFVSLIQCIQTNCGTAAGLDPVCASEVQGPGGICSDLLAACGDDTL